MTLKNIINPLSFTVPARKTVYFAFSEAKAHSYILIKTFQRKFIIRWLENAEYYTYVYFILHANRGRERGREGALSKVNFKHLLKSIRLIRDILCRNSLTSGFAFWIHNTRYMLYPTCCMTERCMNIYPSFVAHFIHC